MSEIDLRSFIRDVPDFPKAGILFRDLTPLLEDPHALRAAVHAIADPFRGDGIDAVVGIESRGFIFGAPVALELGAGFVLIRKKGKLPAEIVQEEYELEYGTDVVEMHADAVETGQRVLLVDDLIATGGTAAAAVRLLEKAGADVAAASFLIELSALGGRRMMGVDRIHAVLEY